MGDATTTPKAPKKKAAKKPAEHPKYEEMITTAIKELKERTGSSRQKITKYLSEHFKVGDNVAIQVKLNLKRLAAAGELIQAKGVGASGSFKVNKAAEVKPKPKPKKKPVAKKPAAKPKKKPAAKKPAAKKAAAKKKPAAKPRRRLQRNRQRINRQRRNWQRRNRQHPGHQTKHQRNSRRQQKNQRLYQRI